MSRPDYPALVLRKGEERRLRAGHPWVFSNEVDVGRSPLAAFAPGQAVVLLDHGGKALGTGYVNPSTLIAARLVDRAGRALDRELLAERLCTALALRERLYPTRHYRLAFGESDGLPGLTVDRFGDVVVAQATTAGMERLREAATAALLGVLRPAALLWKNDSGARALEGLPESVELVHGALDGPAVAREGRLDFLCDLREGQKTGWFYDQRDNRSRLAPYVKDARVLDVFSYLGGWGLRAAELGAREVECVDASARAVEGIRVNIARNGLAGRATATRADAFEFLRGARAERRRWDVVVLDPPAFVKRRKDHKEGALAYRRLNELGLQVVAPGGFLATCSCSHHMPLGEFVDGLHAAARAQGVGLQLLAPLFQSADHPVHPALPETEYLKGVIARVLPG